MQGEVKTKNKESLVLWNYSSS